MDHVQDAPAQVDVLPGERCVFPRVQPEESHGEPKPLVLVRAQVVILPCRHLFGTFGTRLAVEFAGMVLSWWESAMPAATGAWGALNAARGDDCGLPHSAGRPP